jgi:hypothetical protein
MSAPALPPNFAAPVFNQRPGSEADQFPGLTHLTRREYPRVEVQQFQKPIDMMKPTSDLHARVLNHLLSRKSDSERAMAKFHPRWRANEMRNQAWLDLRNYEKLVKEANDSGRPPKAVDIAIPYSFATLSTISTYMLQVFAGRKPHLQVGTYGTALESAQKLEIVLQYQNDHNRVIKEWWKWFNDMGLYGVGILVNRWRVKQALRTRPAMKPVIDLQTGDFTSEEFREQQLQVIYEGSEIFAQDPFMFLPDPRVPMSEVAQRGEYVIWRNFDGKHGLKRAENNGLLKWVDAAPESIGQSSSGQLLSARSLLAGGDPHAGGPWDWQMIASSGQYQVDTYSVELIPRELGIGRSNNVEKWIFTVLNDAQIVQAEQQLDDHGEHPVVISEPYGMGYAFGAPGMSDYVGPLQDSMSWFLNSHMENVRTAINNQFVVDPFAVEMQDVRRPGPGKTIRLKRSAINRDVRAAIQQLPVQDITRGNVEDMNVFFDIGQRISAVTENILGLQAQGGRKTATEVRTSFEAAASRLAAVTRVVSAQGMTALASQMSLNTQQWMSEEFYVRVVGSDGAIHPLVISPDSLVGDFYFPVHDGTLPLDKIAMMDIWKEILVGVLQDPELRQTYSVPKLFEFIAELGGAKNIRSFRLQQMDRGQIQQQAQQGNLAPIPGANGPSGLINATLPQPGNRLQGLA